MFNENSSSSCIKVGPLTHSDVAEHQHNTGQITHYENTKLAETPFYFHRKITEVPPISKHLNSPVGSQPLTTSKLND